MVYIKYDKCKKFNFPVECYIQNVFNGEGGGEITQSKNV